MEKHLISSSFDYSMLDSSTSMILQEKEDTLVGIHNRYSNEVGKVLYEAKEELSNNYQGKFEEWYTALGFKTTNVYTYINAYKYILELESSSKFEELEIFRNQTKSLQNEMSKKSANEELNQLVYDGDITTHKEYKELEKQLKEARAEAEAYKSQHKTRGDNLEVAHRQIDKLQHELENKKPEVKIVEKQVEHPHVNDLRSDNEQLSKALKQAQSEADAANKRNEFIEKEYQSLLDERAEVDEKSEKYDQLTEAIRNAEGRLTNQQKLVSNYKDVLKILRQGNEAILKISGITFMNISETVNGSESASREFDSLIRNLERLIRDLRNVRDENILEGEFTND